MFQMFMAMLQHRSDGTVLDLGVLADQDCRHRPISCGIITLRTAMPGHVAAL
jgi:hypothetical protein